MSTIGNWCYSALRATADRNDCVCVTDSGTGSEWWGCPADWRRDGWLNCFACCFFVPRTEQHPRNWIAYKLHNPASTYSLQTVCCRFIKKWNETQPQPDVNSRSIMPGWVGESDDGWTQQPISAIAASSIHDSLKINRCWRQRSRLAEVIHIINLSKICSQCSIKHLCFHWNLYSFLIRPGD